jgi:hypothetical protein
MVWRGVGLAWRALLECGPRTWDGDGAEWSGGLRGFDGISNRPRNY